VGGIVGIPCGILLAILSGFLKNAIFTVPGCFFLGVLLGAMIYGAEPPASKAKQDEKNVS
jgi:hypothetical protein